MTINLLRRAVRGAPLGLHTLRLRWAGGSALLFGVVVLAVRATQPAEGQVPAPTVHAAPAESPTADPERSAESPCGDDRPEPAPHPVWPVLAQLWSSVPAEVFFERLRLSDEGLRLEARVAQSTLLLVWADAAGAVLHRLAKDTSGQGPSAVAWAAELSWPLGPGERRLEHSAVPGGHAGPDAPRWAAAWVDLVQRAGPCLVSASQLADGQSGSQLTWVGAASHLQRHLPSLDRSSTPWRHVQSVWQSAAASEATVEPTCLDGDSPLISVQSSWRWSPAPATTSPELHLQDAACRTESSTRPPSGRSLPPAPVALETRPARAAGPQWVRPSPASIVAAPSSKSSAPPASAWMSLGNAQWHWTPAESAQQP